LSKLMKEDSSPTQVMAPASLFISFLVIGLSTHYGVARLYSILADVLSCFLTSGPRSVPLIKRTY
jgi:hypothetical protein